MSVVKEDIIKAIQTIGVANNVVCLHSSLRSFGEVSGGADAVVCAFLDAGCTLLAPSFSYSFMLPPDDSIEQNGWDYEESPIKPDGRIFSPEMDDISEDMGAIPRAMVNTPGRFRGYHPTNSFVSLGPKAEYLTGCQTPEKVYAPFEKAMEEHGYIVMAGVDLTRMTAIHYAEQIAGRSLFIRRALGRAGELIDIREGSCSEGFNNLLPAALEYEKRITVGDSLWRVFPFCETIRACAEAIRQNPGITHCADANCARCNDMVKGGSKVR